MKERISQLEGQVRHLQNQADSKLGPLRQRNMMLEAELQRLQRALRVLVDTLRQFDVSIPDMPLQNTRTVWSGCGPPTREPPADFLSPLFTELDISQSQTLTLFPTACSPVSPIPSPAGSRILPGHHANVRASLAAAPSKPSLRLGQGSTLSPLGELIKTPAEGLLRPRSVNFENPSGAAVAHQHTMA